jgi:thiol-disulfide isomerase/thioredoxin
MIRPLALSLAFLSCSALLAQEKYTITTAFHPEGSLVYLYAPSVAKLTKLDSATVKGGKLGFALPKKGKSVRGVYKFGNDKGLTEAVLGSSERAFVLSSEGLLAGGKEQDSYNAYKKIDQATQAGFAQLQQLYNQMAKEGMQPAEQVRVTNLFRKKADSIYVAQDKGFAAIAQKHIGTLAAKMAAYLLPAASEQEATYFPGKPADMQDLELTWPNVIHQKMLIWLQRFLPQDLETYESAALQAIDRAPAGSAYKENLYAVTAMVFGGMDRDFLRPVAKAWVQSYPESQQAKELLAQLPAPQPEVGDIAPDILLNDSAGNVVALSSLRGKVVLIDFWASWCGPCRQENPSVVRVFNQYKDKNFTVYSVSLDQDRKRWLAAITKDKLFWPSHVSDLKGWESAGARSYKITSIPATFLIGKDGQIISKNLRGGKLETELQKLIN